MRVGVKCRIRTGYLVDYFIPDCTELFRIRRNIISTLELVNRLRKPFDTLYPKQVFLDEFILFFDELVAVYLVLAKVSTLLTNINCKVKVLVSELINLIEKLV